MNIRLFVLMVTVLLAAALLVAVVAPRVGLAGGDNPATSSAATKNVGQITGMPNRGGGIGSAFAGVVGPATVLLGECPALPCLLELDIGGQPGYLIVDYPSPRG